MCSVLYITSACVIASKINQFCCEEKMNNITVNFKQKEKVSISLFKQGKFLEAKLGFQNILEENPQNFNSLLFLGRIELLNNNLEKAKEFITKAFKLKPRKRELNRFLGEVYFRLKNYPKASELYERVGRKALAKKLASFNGAEPYQIDSKHKISIIKFIMSEPLPVVQIRVNESKLVNFFIDTGGAEIILDQQFVQEVGAKNFGDELGSFAGGKKAKFQHGRVDSIQIGEFKVKNVPVNIMDIRPISDVYFNGLQLDGAIGTVFLYQFLTSIDYPNEQLILRKKTNQNLSQFGEEAKNSKSRIVPFWLAGDHYMVSWGRVNNSDPMLFFVDTGFVDGGFISPKSTLKTGGIHLDKEKEKDHSGGGGGVKGIPFEIDELSFGDTKQKNIRGFYFGPFPIEKAFGFHVGGLISHQYFRNYTLTIDFVKMRYFLKKK